MATPSLAEEAQMPSTPMPAKTVQGALVASHQLAASQAWERSGDRVGDAGVISLQGARRITLWVTYTSDPASGASGYAELMPLVSGFETKPAAGDDSWFAMDANDGTVTPKTLVGALPTGSDFDVQPDFGQVKGRSLLLATEPADSNSDDIRKRWVLEVGDARWFQVIYHEGHSSGRGTLKVAYTLST